MKHTGLAILVSVCALMLAQPAFAATTHYVLPTGSGTTCSESVPCDLVGALTGLVSGDTIMLGAGDYDLGVTGISLPAGVSLIGAPGTSPSITSNTITSTVSVFNAAVKNVSINQTGTGSALSSFGSTLDDLTVTSSGFGVLLNAGDVLRDSVVRLTGSTTGSAINAAGMGSMDLRNVLLWAPDTAVGIQAAGNCFPLIIDPMLPPMCLPIAQPTVNARNTIIRAGTDLLTSGFSGFNGVINVAYSDYRAAKTTAQPAGTIVDGGGNIAGDPLFADATNGDFHQLAGSPTIDAGDPLAASDTLLGALDFDGLARIVGGLVDIGPDEFVPTTTQTTPPVDTGGSQQQTTDNSGNTAPVTTPAVLQAPAADKTAPRLESLRIAPGKLRKKSARISYLVNEAGATTLTVARKTTGVKKGRTCAKAPRKLKKGAKRCTRWVVVRGTLGHTNRVGQNSLRFTGKLRGKRLAAGSYRLIAIARDAAGNVGKPVMVSFKVLGRR